MNHDDSLDTEASTYRPDWWSWNPASEDASPHVVASAFAALGGRLAAIGDLLGATGEAGLRVDTRLWLGEVIRDYGCQAKALAFAIERCGSQTKSVAAAPDSLDQLREAAERVRYWKGDAEGLDAQQALILHARVIGEIDAGNRAEDDYLEADALLDELLRPKAVGKGGEAAA